MRLLLWRFDVLDETKCSIIEISTGRTVYQISDAFVRFHADSKHLVSCDERSGDLTLRDATSGRQVKVLAKKIRSRPQFTPGAERAAFVFQSPASRVG